MSSFSTILQGLFSFLERQNTVPPTQDVQVIEIAVGTDLDDRGRLRIGRKEFCEPADYENRFDTLMKSGLPWINVSAYGVSEGKLIVAIELPQMLSNISTQTSVNFSGPALTVLEHGWNANRV